MNSTQTAVHQTLLTRAKESYGYLLHPLFGGLLLPFGFAPFHLPGLAILGITLLFSGLSIPPKKHAFLVGFIFGLGFLGVGVSWVYVSIHDYGHLHALLSFFITLLFIIYLALYFGFMTFAYQKLARNHHFIFKSLLFSALWCFSEYLRSTVLGGFPWLLLGVGQVDTPLKFLLPLIGLYGTSFAACFAATLLAHGFQASAPIQRYTCLVAFVGLFLFPSLFKYIPSTTTTATPLSVGIIQANLSMRDKWDETLFWNLVNYYKKQIKTLLGRTKLIVMPESAIPLPSMYISDILDTLDQQVAKAGSALLLGMPQLSEQDQSYYHNALLTLGLAQGVYLKQHLVPFGEFIPRPFENLLRKWDIPMTNLKPGKPHQLLIHAQHYAIATLICYELAYPALLRQQLPEAAFIVSISDDGWFGHSLAMYQQLQLSQVLSMQTGRYQIVANNDGLSSIINTQGEIIASLPAFSAGLLEATILPAMGTTLWVYTGDLPVIIIFISIILYSILVWIKQKRSK